MLSCKHSKFTLSPGVTFLNCAYMSPMLKSVEKAGINGLRLKRNPVHITGEHFFDTTNALRQAYAKTINADASEIAIIPSASYGIATVAKNVKLQNGQSIVVAGEQFPSNYYAWESLCKSSGGTMKVVSAPDSLKHRGSKWNEEILAAIDSSTKVVALGHVHWADGTLFDLKAIRAKTKSVGALLIIDGTQSVGALPFDVKEYEPDALIVAGYKWMMGPYSIGLAWYGPAFSNASPLEENWINRKNSEDFSKLVNYESIYKPGASRFEVGEHSNFILVPMMLKAVEQINRWNPAFIQEYCRTITSDSIRLLQENGFWIEDDSSRGSHLFGIRLPKDKELSHIKLRLQEKKIFVSYRGDVIRVSPNVYNTASDVERLAHALIRP